MTSASTFSKAQASESSEAPEIKTSRAQPAFDTLPEKHPPLSEQCWLHGQPPASGEVWVLTSEEALQQVAEHAYSDTGRELGGALLGHAFRYQKTVFVEVLAAIPALSDDHGPVHFTFTADSWPQLQQDRDEHYPDLEIVGWFHTHPGLGVFYSSDDVVVHSAAFVQPWHVGLVFDPIRNDACFFGWVNNELAPLQGFYELLDNGETIPSIDWRVVRTSVWHHNSNRMSTSLAEDGNPNTTAVFQTTLTTQLWLSTGVGVAGLLLSMLLFIAWFGQRQQLNNMQAILTNVAQTSIMTQTNTCNSEAIRILSPLPQQTIIAGTAIPIIGTANHLETTRYRVQVRPVGFNEWQLLNVNRRRTALAQLALWDTTTLEPTTYELRLAAVDPQNPSLLLENVDSCLITVNIIDQS